MRFVNRHDRRAVLEDVADVQDTQLSEEYKP